MIAGIAAVSSNGMIGMNGWLPWDIPEDVAYFENMIVGAALVVGSRTYRTMAVVPPDTFVVSRQAGLALRVVVGAPNGGEGWIDWPGAPLPEGAEVAVKVGNAGQALSSAIAGMGRAALPFLLAEDAIRDGRLSALEGPAPGRRAYWLVAPLPQWRQKKVRALVGHLVAAR